jgi:hypothetical protein
MGLFKKKPDPVSDRGRLLDEQIAALESQIKQLSTRMSSPETPAAGPKQPRLRTTAIPHGPTVPATPPPPPAAPEPVFEEVGLGAFKGADEAPAPAPSPDLGVRKQGSDSIWARIKKHFEGPTTSNPKLVNYLAAGSIQGLRPLRYEKRVARNRFIVLVVLLIVVLLGFFAVFLRH